MKGEDCQIGVFFTTSSYTERAKDWAEKKHIVLVDRPKLLKKIQTELSDQQQKELLSEATKGDYRTPTCVNCDIKLVPREGKNGKPFWGCKNYPISGCNIKSFENIDHIVAQLTAEATRSCPKCNGELEIKTSNRGANKGSQFWGCKNYSFPVAIIQKTYKSNKATRLRSSSVSTPTPAIAQAISTWISSSFSNIRNCSKDSLSSSIDGGIMVNCLR